jgi:predicted aminopeptidase
VASPEPGSAPAAVNVQSTLYAFTSESDADSWMASRENALLTTPSATTTYQRVSDAPALADAAAVFTMATLQQNGPELSGYRIYARSGTIVAIVDVQSAPAVSLRGAVGLVEEQLACIAAQGCSGNASLPGSIFGTRDRPED